jgi:hypothetical protein
VIWLESRDAVEGTPRSGGNSFFFHEDFAVVLVDRHFDLPDGAVLTTER